MQKKKKTGKMGRQSSLEHLRSNGGSATEESKNSYEKSNLIANVCAKVWNHWMFCLKIKKLSVMSINCLN